MTVQEAATIVDILQKAAQIIAFSVGAWWVYMLSGRTYVRRLQLELSASLNSKEARHYLLVTVMVRNVGLRTVKITQRGSALLVSRLKAWSEVTEVMDAQWDFESAFDVLVGKNSIEPGITTSEERLILLPPRQDGTRLVRVRVVAHGRSYSTTRVVAMPLSEEPS